MKIKKVGRWELKEELGKGGNGLVFRAVDNPDEAAIKILRNPDRIGRFRDEIEGMQRLEGTAGVIPLIDYDTPEKPSKKNPAWFAMPIAEPLTDALGKNPRPEEIVCALRDIATTLAEIHKRGFSHRDIKPDNLFRFEGLWSVGDFGLIEFEGKSHNTALGEKIGPMHFIAPEMLLGVTASDGKLADVFSLAKTLWVLLSGANFPIPGSYDASSEIYKLKSYVAFERSVELDKLIQQCTAVNPNERPTMSDVAKELLAWTNMQSGNSGSDSLKPYEPAGADWNKVIEAAQSEKLARIKHNELHSETRAAVNRLFDDLKIFYSEIIGDLNSLGFGDIDGIKSTVPPGISVRFPQKASPENRLEMEFKVWLNADWSDLGKRRLKGMARCHMKIGAKGKIEELYRVEDQFVIDGPAEMKFIESVKTDVKSLLRNWLERCTAEWELLP